MGVLDALGLIFVGLKLTHYIDWSWWVVLSPFSITILAVVVAVVAALIHVFVD